MTKNTKYVQTNLKTTDFVVVERSHDFGKKL